MAKTKQPKGVLPYLQRLADDEYIHEQIHHAYSGLTEASRRISRKRGKAAEDKQLYANLRQAATSIRNASNALRRRKPEPKRRGRKVMLVVVTAGGVAVLVSQREKVKSVFSGDSGAEATEAPAPVGATTASPASEAAGEPAPQSDET
jgi:hypothetical protein